MPTKGVMDRQRVGEALIAAARTHAQRVGERLQTKLATVLEDGAPLPDLTRFQLQLARMVEERLAGLVAADDSRDAELAEDPLTRRRRDEAAAAVREQILIIRRITCVALGPDQAAGALALRGPTAESPLLIMRQGTRLLETLRRRRGKLPQPRIHGVRIEIAPAMAALRTHLAELSAALRDVEVERRQASRAKVRRDKAIEAFDHLLRRVAGVLVNCYELAGFPHYARRIRVRPRKRRVATAAPGKEG